MTRHQCRRILSGCVLLLDGLLSLVSAQVLQSATVRVNDIEMHYQLLGSGEPLVLLHGFGGCADDWQPFTQILAKQYQLIIPDLRGHGLSTNPTKVFTHQQSAMDVLALLDRLGLRSVRAMGISTGGMTLLHIATRQPERIDAMVLIGGSEQLRELSSQFTAFKDSYDDMNFTAP